jgi:polynucleotide 5'-hydroxyl-kinase GRC3/NOL9
VEEDNIVPRPPKHLRIQISNFTPNIDNVVRNDEHCFEFSMQENETATFIGEYKITVSSGIITIYGTVLRPNSAPTRVFATSVSALPQIQARQNNTTVRVLPTKSGIRKLGKLSPLFRNIWNATSESQRSFQFLATSDDDALKRSLSPLEIDRDMDAVLRTLSAKSVTEREQPRIMAIGGKSSGKSTFNRVLCNHLHSWTPGKRCYYLDLDPGQPEFGPPGQTSLIEVSAPVIGPPFTHPASSDSACFRLVRSHTIAATTFKDDPTHYKACAKDLVAHADSAYPLVINACGWTSGTGATVLLDLCVDLAITDAVLLEPLDVNLVETLQSASSDIMLHRIARRAPGPSTRSPAESRAMQTMAYFHCKGSTGGDVLKFSGKPVSQLRRWNVSFGGPDPGIAAVMSYNQGPNPEYLTEVLNGSMVAIVVLQQNGSNLRSELDDGTEMLQNISEPVSRTPEDIPYIEPNNMGINQTLDPGSSHCVGLALVRSIDTKDKYLHLVTPLTEKEIEGIQDKQVVLVRGSFDAPGWAYLEDVNKDDFDGKDELEDVDRPWISERVQVGIEGAVWRLRHPPLANSVNLK